MRSAKLLVRLSGTLISLALTLTAIPLTAQQESPAAVNQVGPGTALIARMDVPLRDRPPGGGAVYLKGSQTGVVSKGERVFVQEQPEPQTVSTLLGTQKWVPVYRPGKSPATGWVLVGNVGATSDRFDRNR
jgi:hypothetical protein